MKRFDWKTIITRPSATGQKSVKDILSTRLKKRTQKETTTYFVLSPVIRSKCESNVNDGRRCHHHHYPHYPYDHHRNEFGKDDSNTDDGSHDDCDKNNDEYINDNLEDTATATVDAISFVGHK